jgi:hypothetical protein
LKARVAIRDTGVGTDIAAFAAEVATSCEFVGIPRRPMMPFVSAWLAIPIRPAVEIPLIA